MAPKVTTLGSDTPVGIVMSHLPITRTTDYAKGQVIYGRSTLAKNIYLLITGSVEISHIAEDNREVLLEVVRPDEVFGLSAILDDSRSSERAKAIEKTVLMSWPVSEMEDIAWQQPRLAMAFLHIIGQRNAEFTRRIESFAIDSIERRLARSLIRFSERLGTPDTDGVVDMMPMTHAMLARYIGTSREIVTHHMTNFRKQGFVSYSRRGIRLYHESLKTVFGIGHARTAMTSS